jgi:hypothetical protein
MPESNDNDLIWGAAAIARVIKRSLRTTFFLLENGHLPAKKVGGRWVTTRAKLMAHLLGEQAT